MPISSIKPGVSFTQTRELPGVKAEAAKQRAVVATFADSLPGRGKSSQAPQEIRRVTADITRISQAFNKKLDFIVDYQSNEVIVKVIDRSTDKVIKVLPPEELQRLHRKLKETIGFLFNEQV